ncbi:MAG TPA: hypothetical protein V6D16_10675, partial [Candidatus Obscuribacterales bacterium]
RIEAYIIPDARLMIWGKVDRRDDRNQFIIDDAEPVEEVRMLMVELDPQRASDIEAQHRLRTILLEHRGEEDKAKIPVVAIISASNRRQFVRLGAQFRVQNYQAAVNGLAEAGFQARASALVNA